MESYTLTLEQNPKREEVKLFIDNLSAYNASQAKPEDDSLLTIFLRDSGGHVVGGIRGHTLWGWLHISHLWLPENLRGKGYGRKLVVAAEREAVGRGCGSAHLDTFSFQAREFYEKLGYEVFGVLTDYPEGHSRYYLRKRYLS
jgi:GNAT superfamily N-acetyltransferase